MGMRAEELVMFGTAIITMLSIAGAVVCGIPFVARLKFRERTDCIRDDAIDAVLERQLPWSPPVRHFVAKVEGAGDAVREVTFVRAYCLHRALRETGATPPTSPSYGELDAAERRLLHEYESRFNKAVVRLLLSGSPVGWFATLLRPFEHHMDRSRDELPSMKELADEYTESDFLPAATPARLVGFPRPC
jgi:hypothetical protein